MRTLWGAVLMTAISTAVLAQGGGGAKVYTTSQMHNMAQKLEQQKGFATTGTAGETLEKYRDHFTMLTVRNQSGGAELHEHYADIFFVVDGEATLTTGGTILDRENAGPGEVRGKAIEGGVKRHLSKGDVVHISPNTPHQLSVPRGRSFTYFVVKVHEQGKV